MNIIFVIKYINDYINGVNWVSEHQELDVQGMWKFIQQHVPLCKNNENRNKYSK